MCETDWKSEFFKLFTGATLGRDALERSMRLKLDNTPSALFRYRSCNDLPVVLPRCFHSFLTISERAQEPTVTRFGHVDAVLRMDFVIPVSLRSLVYVVVFADHLPNP